MKSLVMAALFAFALLMLAIPVHAYDASDTFAAIDQVAADTGVSHTWLTSIIKCETGGTFSPNAVGRLGEIGAVQLYRRGELPRFFAYGYDDPWNPYQAVEFLAIRLTQGGARAWSCA